MKRQMPSVDNVIFCWRGHVSQTVPLSRVDGQPLRLAGDSPDIEVGELPHLRAYFIGWGEPFCFGCGWLPPVPEGLPTSWRRAGAWLDRAHLQDHRYAGDDSPRNIVMLCHLCHSRMPSFESRDEALRWVSEVSDVEAQPGGAAWQVWTDIRLRGRIPTRTVTLFRARAEFLESVVA